MPYFSFALSAATINHLSTRYMQREILETRIYICGYNPLDIFYMVVVVLHQCNNLPGLPARL